MGGGASAPAPAEVALVAAEEHDVPDAVADGAANIGQNVEQVLDRIPAGEIRDKASELLGKAGSVMPEGALGKVTGQMCNAASSLEGNALLAKLGSLCQTAAEESGPVIDVVMEVLGGVASHLPFISMAGYLLNGIYQAFKRSKIEDTNVKNVLLWSKSVGDWLLLVANRVETSAAESCTQLFETLKDSLASLKAMCSSFADHWRITKMIVSSSFHEKLERSKGHVKDLKEALRDYLDAEATEHTHAMLGGLEEAAMRQSAKLDSVDDQLCEIKALLEGQHAGHAPAEELPEEEKMFQLILKGAGIDEGDNVPMDDFLLAIEHIFLAGEDMTEETSQGLAVATDRNHDGAVSKLEWIKLYKRWQGSGLAMEQFLNDLAANAPAPTPIPRPGNGNFVSAGNGDRMTVKGTVMQITNAGSGQIVATVVNAVTPQFVGGFPWGQITMVWTGEMWVEQPGGCCWNLVPPE